MKDAKGHGSEARGGGVDQSKPLKDAGIIRAKGISAMYGPGSPGYPTSPLSINGMNATMDRARAAALTSVNALSDKDAAATLAQGSPKSAPVAVHPAMQSGDARQYSGTVKVGRSYQTVGPHPSREAAAASAFALNPKAKTVSTGYGYKGSFDMQWHNRGDR
jgi:hypothetical protein